MLLDPAGRLKLADFGLSHIMARQSVRADDIAKDPSIVGTPFYMAPETIRGKARFF
jgi:serine/threonine protein kinase